METVQGKKWTSYILCSMQFDVVYACETMCLDVISVRIWIFSFVHKQFKIFSNNKLKLHRKQVGWNRQGGWFGRANVEKKSKKYMYFNIIMYTKKIHRVLQIDIVSLYTNKINSTYIYFFSSFCSLLFIGKLQILTIVKCIFNDLLSAYLSLCNDVVLFSMMHFMWYSYKYNVHQCRISWFTALCLLDTNFDFPSSSRRAAVRTHTKTKKPSNVRQ